MNAAFIAGVVQLLGFQCENGQNVCPCPQITHTIDVEAVTGPLNNEDFEAGFQWALGRDFDPAACRWITRKAQQAGILQEQQK